MKHFQLPALPKGLSYGAEVTFALPENGNFQAPSGYALKSVDMETKIAICVPIQQLDPVNGVWKIIQG